MLLLLVLLEFGLGGEASQLKVILIAVLTIESDFRGMWEVGARWIGSWVVLGYCEWG